MAASTPRCTVDRSTPGTLVVSGALQFNNATESWVALTSALPRGCDVRLDLAAVSHADSAGLACLLALMADARRKGSTLSIEALPEGLKALATVSQVDALLLATPHAA